MSVGSIPCFGDKSSGMVRPLTADLNLLTDHSNKFDSTWRIRTSIRHVERWEADWMIRRHYLHKWPGVVVCTLGMEVDATLAGVIVFALPPRETSVRYNGPTWELARLWIDDSIPRNAETWLIGQAVKHIKRTHRDVAYLVSYADPSAGHQGTIYRAANWTVDGMTDQGRKTPRCDYLASGLFPDQPELGKRFSRRNQANHLLAILVPRVSKHRFVYRLRRAERGAGQQQ